MRIENISKDNVKELMPVELRNFKIRFLQIYDNHFSDPLVKEAVDLDRHTFYNKYIILRNEMHSRNIKYMEDSPLDKVKDVNVRAFLKSVYGLDVPALDEVAIVKSYVAISGAFMKTPKGAKGVDVVVRNVEANKDEALEQKIALIIKAKTGKEPRFIYRPEGPEKTHMPVFDLVLKACDEIKIIKTEKPELKKALVKDTKKEFDIKKPEETDNIISIPVGPACEVTATITIDKTQGITALYCGKIKRVRTFKFDKRIKAWTTATARAWIKAHPVAKMEKEVNRDYEKESVQIRENAKVAKYPHDFKAAKWTHPNGHPRCIHCGDEERVDAKDNKLPCEKPVAKFTIIKIDKKKQIVGGVVYEPNEEDTQGDYTDKKEIEKAMYRFMEKYATDTKRIRISHKGRKMFFPIMESFIPDHDTIKGDKPLKAGSWWLEIKITNPKIWDAVESGELTGFSMGGRAKA